MSRPVIRILTDLIIYSSLFLLTWWAAAALSIIALFCFEDYFEIILFGFLLDNLSHTYIFTIIAGVLFLVSFFLADRIRL